MIRIKEVNNKKDKDDFIKFQYPLYAEDKHFVPPLLMDRYKLLNQEKNPFFKNNDSQLFLAYKDNKIVGRIAAIENLKHNEIHKENYGFFGFFECINDQDVAKALIDTVIKWNKEKGFSEIVGPVNPHLNDDSPGVLIKGLDDDPVMLLAYSKDYYPNLLEGCGLSKAKDLYSYYVDSNKIENEEQIRRINEKSIKRHNLSIRKINMKNFEEDYLAIQNVFNKAWEKNWGQVPLSKEDFEYIASDLKPIIHTDFIQLAYKEDTLIGISVAFPDINELIKDMNGSLFSFKAIKFFKYLLFKKSKIKRLRIFILGVLPEYDRTGATSMLYLSLIDNTKKHNIIGGEMAWILEDNEKMNKAAKSLGGEHCKTYRIYSKKI
jgi:GNAT superfamily N-acetyltransferase